MESGTMLVNDFCIAVKIVFLICWIIMSVAITDEEKNNNNVKEYLNKNGIQVWHLLIAIPVCIFLMPSIILFIIKQIFKPIIFVIKSVFKPILTFKIMDMEKHSRKGERNE